MRNFSPTLVLLVPILTLGCPAEPIPNTTTSGGNGGEAGNGGGNGVSSSSSGMASSSSSSGMASSSSSSGSGGAGGMANGGAGGMGGMTTGGAGGMGGGGNGGSGGNAACPANEHICGLVCESNSSLETCGASCEPCVGVPNGTPTCNGSTCGAACAGNDKLCNGACVATCFTCAPKPITRCDRGFEPYVFTEEVISTGSISPSNARIEVDPAGTIHAAYTNRITPVRIEYATNKSGTWAVEVVANASNQPSAAVSRAHLLLGACAAPHVAYMRTHVPAGSMTGVQQAWLGKKNGASWTEELIPFPTNSIDPTPSTNISSFDIVADPAGNFYAVGRSVNTAFVLQRDLAGVWTAETLPFGVNGVEVPVISWHPTMGVILAYGSVPRIAVKVAGVWTESVVPGAKPLLSSGFNNQPQMGVAADANETVYLAWGAGEANGSDSLYVSRRIAGTWTTPIVHTTATGWAADNLHVWVDANNLPRMTTEVYATGGSVSPQWSLTEDDQWLKRAVGTGTSGTAVGNTDDVGRLFLLVDDQTSLKMRYANCTMCSGDFCPQLVAGAGTTGTALSLAVEPGGKPLISYSDTTSGAARLRLARWNGSRWVREIVDTGIAGYQSMALDSMARPQISYWDITNGDLKHAAFDGTSWKVSVVDGMASSVGGFNSMAIDKMDQAHISYFDTSNSDLKYAHWNGATWDISTVDSAGDVGRFGSLAVDAQNHPHIAYLDFDNRDLKYATFDGTMWKIETIDPMSSANATSIAIDSTGKPHILYYDAAMTNDVKYASWDGTQWSVELVLAQGDVGYAPDLAFDAQDTPHIVFGDLTAKSVVYGVKGAMGWTFQTVDKFSNSSGTNAIVLDGKGRAHLAYDDPNNSDVLYARR